MNNEYLRSLQKVTFKRKPNAKINAQVCLMPNQEKIVLYKDNEWYYTRRPNKENQYGGKEWAGIYGPSLLKFYEEEKR